METNKKSKGLIVLAIVLIICVLGLGGYIVYDKLSTKPTQTTDNTKSSTIKPNEFDIELKNLKFPNENDDSVIVYGLIDELIDSNTKNSLDMYKNYKNVYYMINGLEFEESCIDYYVGIDAPSLCKNSEMTINGKVKINFALDIPYSEQKFILITDKNIIVQKGLGAISLGNIEIYDYQGNLIKTIKNATSYLVFRDDNCKTLYDSNKAYDIRVIDNKLHYITDAGKVAYKGAIYKTFDLETHKENIIGTINASTTQQC